MNESKPEAGCAPHPIAQGPLGHVAACPGCGNVQLTLEYLTLRFQPAAFRELVGLLSAAQRRLDGDPPIACAPRVEPAPPAAAVPADETFH